LKLAAFLLFSAAWAYVSRAALRRTQAHGFYRFLAWEAITALILANLEAWFRDPFSLVQILSWGCLLISLFLVIHSMALLSRLGQPAARRAGETLIGFEKTTTLVTAGAYRYIRHPMYSSLLFLALGAFLKAPSLFGLALTAAAAVFLTATARVEEGENLGYFGEEYARYMRQTRRFIPYLF
jgi:protein-S-isoprenylcysteine O-methyltransferase Ste14